MEKTIFILLAAFFITSESIHVDMQLQYIDQFAANCTKPGMVCDGCDASYICIDVGGGNFIPELVQNCVEDQMTCLAATGECTADENLDCNQGARNYKFRCHQKGMFPHPFFCDQYFICCDESITSPPEGISSKCNNGFNYTPLSTLCNKKGDCETPPVKSCKVAGEVGGVDGHPSMYFVCLNRLLNPDSKATTLLPDLYLCPNDQVFVNGACTSSSKGLDSDGKCLAAGVFYDPEECQKYFECQSQGVLPFVKSCAFGYKFNPVNGLCQAMSC